MGLHHTADRFVDGAGRPVGHALHRVDLRRRPRQLLAHQAEFGDLLSELAALRGVRCSRAQRPLHAAHREGRQLEPAHVEDVEGDLVALADLAEQVFRRDPRVLEDQGRGRAAADAELVLFAAGGEPRRAALDDQRAEAARLGL